MIADAGHLWIEDSDSRCGAYLDSDSRCGASFGRRVGLDDRYNLEDRYTRGGPIACGNTFGDPTPDSR